MKTFKNFICDLKSRKSEFAIISSLLIIIGIGFYFLYPFPFFYSDSATYMFSAWTDSFSVYRPMGYSWYLRGIHNICGNIHFVFCVTYLLHCIAGLFLLYSFRYLTELKNKYVFYGLCIFTFLSPTLLFSTNFIMSDGIFNSLTMLFLATAIWITYNKSWGFIIIHLMIFCALYLTRYSGMFYLPVTIITLFFAFRKQRILLRIVVCCIPVLVLLTLQSIVRKEYQKITHVNTTSGFGGWQLMNNASVLIPKAKEIPLSEFKTEKERLLHRFFSTVPDSLFTTKAMLTTNLMWNNASPLKQFVFSYQQWSRKQYPIAWVEVGQLYAQYAQKLILKYPGNYITKFILPSLGSFFTYQEIFEDKFPFTNEKMYNEFYGLKENYTHSCNLYRNLVPVRHVSNYIYWTIVFCTILFFLIRMFKFDWKNPLHLSSFLLLAFICFYIGVSALASPNTTWRYALPVYMPSILLFSSILFYRKKS